jgi:hypothetical protein
MSGRPLTLILRTPRSRNRTYLPPDIWLYNHAHA